VYGRVRTPEEKPSKNRYFRRKIEEKHVKPKKSLMLFLPDVNSIGVQYCTA
jgi:hypothetical protein